LTASPHVEATWEAGTTTHRSIGTHAPPSAALPEPAEQPRAESAVANVTATRWFHAMPTENSLTELASRSTLSGLRRPRQLPTLTE
jgi:hypothetical protein